MIWNRIGGVNGARVFASSVSGDYAVLTCQNADNEFTVYVVKKNLAGIWDDSHVFAIHNPDSQSENNPEGYERFGVNVVISGNLLTISCLATNTHKVDLYRRVSGFNSWIKINSFELNNPVIDTAFGAFIAMNKDYLLITDYNACTRSKGTVYIYKLNNNGSSCRLKGELTSPEPVYGCRFGSSVGISGNSIIVGSSGVDQGYGAAYVYNKSSNGWNYVKKISKPSSEISEWSSFGTSVAIYGDYATVASSRGMPLKFYTKVKIVNGIRVLIFLKCGMIVYAELLSMEITL